MRIVRSAESRQGSLATRQRRLRRSRIRSRKVGRWLCFCGVSAGLGVEAEAMDSLGAALGPLSALGLIGIFGVRGVLQWTLLPGLIAATCFAFMAPAGRRSEGSECAGHSRQPPSASKNVLVFSGRSIYTRGGRLRADAADFARDSDSDAAIRHGHGDDNRNRVVHVSQRGELCGVVSGWRAWRQIGQARAACVGIHAGGGRIRWFYFRAAHVIGPGCVFALAGVHGGFRRRLRNPWLRTCCRA